MASYERITYKAERGTVIVILRDPEVICTKIGDLLTGQAVNRDGEPVEPSAAWLRVHNAATGTVRHVISLELVTARTELVEDIYYGGLVTPDRAAKSERRMAEMQATADRAR